VETAGRHGIVGVVAHCDGERHVVA
jgi:hypothetical protein